MLKTIPELVAQARTEQRCITIKQAQQEIAENQGIMIDVREPAEVEASPIAHSINIPRGVLEMKASAEYPDPNTPIYIHCATGARATLSAQQLQRLGYKQVAVITCTLEQIRHCLDC